MVWTSCGTQRVAGRLKLVPHDPQAAPIVVAYTDFPGLYLRFGSWHTEPFPDCGCDACDETADGSIEKMIRMVEAVVSGGFREAMRVPPLLGDGWQETEFRPNDGHGGPRRSRGRVPRSRALEMTGGRTARDAGVEALASTQRSRRVSLALLRMVDSP